MALAQSVRHHNPAGTNVVALPVVIAQGGYLDVAPGARRLDKLTVSYIDSHVIGGFASMDMEEDQIAAL